MEITNIKHTQNKLLSLLSSPVTRIATGRRIPSLSPNGKCVGFFLGPATDDFRIKAFPTYSARLPCQLWARQMPPASLSELEWNVPSSQTWQATCSLWSVMGLRTALHTPASKEDMQISSPHYFKANDSNCKDLYLGFSSACYVFMHNFLSVLDYAGIRLWILMVRIYNLVPCLFCWLIQGHFSS